MINTNRARLAELRIQMKTAVDLPSEEDKGKPSYDEDFKAGFAAGKAAYAKNDQVSSVDADKAFKKVQSKHGNWWKDGYTAAIDIARGATGTKPAQIAKKMKLAAIIKDDGGKKASGTNPLVTLKDIAGGLGGFGGRAGLDLADLLDEGKVPSKAQVTKAVTGLENDIKTLKNAPKITPERKAEQTTFIEKLIKKVKGLKTAALPVYANSADMRRLANTKQAASELPLSDVPPRKLQVAEDLGLHVMAAWDGPHGYILQTRPGAVDRLTEVHLKKLLANPEFRWLSPAGSRGGWTLGV